MSKIQHILLVCGLLWLALPNAWSQQEINVQGNMVTIVDGANTPSLTDHTDFGSVAVGGAALVRTFTIQNLGTAPLTVSGVAVSGMGSTEFSVGTLTPASPIPASGSATFTVTFSGANGGIYEPEIVIANNDSDENPYNFKIKATATGPEIEIQGGFYFPGPIQDGRTVPTLLDGTDFGYFSDDALCFGFFPANPPGSAFVVTNLGTSNLQVTSFTLTGPGSAAFAVDPFFTSLPWNIVPGANESVTINGVAGTAPGTYTATLTFFNSDQNEAVFNFDLKMIVESGTAPRVNVHSNGQTISAGSTSPSSSNNTHFGTFNQGGASSSKQYTVWNVGTAEFTSLDVALSPSTQGFSIPAMANNVSMQSFVPKICIFPNDGTFDIQFTPGSLLPGIYEATVSVTSDDPGSPYTFVVRAEVVAGSSCPTLTTAPANVSITNSSCNSSCTVAGGLITAPSGTPCPAGSSLQYRVNSGAWSSTLPTYAQTGPTQSVETRCLCDLDGVTASPISAAIATVPGTCTTPTLPTITIVNNVCPATTGTISATGCGAGTVLEWSLSAGGPFSTTAPTYTTSALTVYARCRNTTTNCVSTNASATTAPNTCPTCPILSAAPSNVTIVNSTCNSSCTVAGGTITAPTGTPCPAGSTLQYRVNSVTWLTTLPTYAQTGPTQSVETRCLCDLDGVTASPISAAIATVPGTCTTPTLPTITIVNNVCPATTGTISATGCGAGTVLEWSLSAGGPFSTTAPTYTTSALTVFARCRNTTTNCVSTNASATTAPNPCPTCPILSAAPSNVTIVNSTCNTSCTVAGGTITAPTGTPCPVGSTLQYRVNSGTWSATLPIYAQTGPAQSIETRCLCDLDMVTASPISAAVPTVPGTCTTPTQPSITIVENVCPSTTGTISATGCGTGTVLEWSLSAGGPFSTTAPTYTTSALTVFARCRNTTTNCVSTNASATTAPNPCPTCPILSAAPSNVTIVNSTCNTSCTVAGGTITAPAGTPCPVGSTLQYRVNSGTWSATLPTYVQTGPAQSVETRCLCDLDGVTASPISAAIATVPGTCTTPTQPSITIIENVCPATTGTISATGCGAGTVLEWSLSAGGPFSTTAPTYTTSALTVYARCRNTTTNCVSTNASATTAPNTCPTCPILSAAPSNVTIVNSTCNTACTVAGGTITTPTGTPCPAGSTLQYRVNGGTWSATLPTYAQSGPAQSVETRCLCDLDGVTASPISAAIATVPGTCTIPTQPTITIIENVCPATTGTISATGCGTGTVLEWSLSAGGPFSTTAPTYTTSAITVFARCRNTTTNCVSTNASATTAPNPCPTCPILSAAPSNVTIVNSTCNTSCTVAGGTITAPAGTPCPAGSTLQYRVNSGIWSGTLPTYAQTGPAQSVETRCLCDLDMVTASPISAAVPTVPGTCTIPTQPSITIVENVCPSTTGTISATGCGTGTILEWSLSAGGPFSTTAPTYITSALTVFARCRNTTTNCVSTNASATTAPNPCPTCPILSAAPSNVTIVNSTCNTACTVAGGTITAPTGTPCPVGSTLQYRVNSGTWSATLPIYAQTGPAQSIETRCLCDLDMVTASPISAAVPTVPGTCTTPTQPTITIVENVCPSTTGTISATGCGTGTVLEWSLSAGGPFSITVPTYTASAITVFARCRNTTTNCVSTNASATTAPNPCPTCPILSAAPSNVTIVNSTCNTSCTVAGGTITAPAGTPCPVGSTLQYRVNSGTWSATLPTYAQTGPAQSVETRCLCDLDGVTASPISAAIATVPGTCTTPTQPSITIIENVCPATTGTISATGCGAGTVLEWSLSAGGPFSTTAPTYTTSALTVFARCRNTTTNCVSTNASATTAPNTCPTCPILSAAPSNVTIVNSTCNTACTVAGGTITTPTGTPCPAGSTLQYRVNGGSWTATLPTYAQSGPAQSFETRCLCDLDGVTASPISAAIATVPGTCTTPTQPSITIIENVCPATTGTISATGCGAGTVLEWSLSAGGPFSTTAPTYTTSALTVFARCRNTTTNCVSTNASATTAPNTCPTCPILSAAPSNVTIVNSTCNTSCTVAGGTITAPSGTPCPAGSTLQYRENSGSWSAILPTYAQTGPAQSIETRCLCDLDMVTASPVSAAVATIPGTCTTPTQPTITIIENVCPATIGTISATGCGAGTVLEWSLSAGGPFTTMVPTYTTSAITVFARCRNTTTNCVSTNASATTAPNTCPTCPILSAAPSNVTIVNSTCNTACTVAGGTITAPAGTPCPAGSTLQYRVNGGTWTATLPTYAQSGPAQSIETRCLCDLDMVTASPISAAIATVPGTCTTPTQPTITIIENVCPATIGTISATGCGAGTVLEWSLTAGGPFSTTVPTYTTSAITVFARCRNTTTNCVSTTASANTAPVLCPGCPTLTTAPGNVSITNSSCQSGCTVAGGNIIAPSGTPCPAGSTIQYRVNGGAWSTILPTYAQTGSAQSIETRCLCDQDLVTASPASAPIVTVPGACTNPSVTITATGELTCSGTSEVMLTANTSASVWYAWTPTISLSAPNIGVVYSPGLYSVVANDGISGCQGSASINVVRNTTPPVVALTNGGSITCTRITDTLTVTPNTGATYIWSSGTAPIVGTNTALVSTTGTYYVTVTQLSNSCTASASVNVVSDSIAPVVNLTKSGDLTCIKLTDTLTATPAMGASYLWSSGAMPVAGTNKAVVSAIGTYSVTVTQLSNGCTATSSINVGSNTAVPTVHLTKSGKITCTQPSVTITGDLLTGFNYTWSAGAIVNGPNTAQASTPGTYSVTVTNQATGCSATASTLIELDTIRPQIQLTNTGDLTCLKDSSILSASAPNADLQSIRWFVISPLFGVVPVDSFNHQYIARFPAQYAVTLSDSLNGCSNTQQIWVFEDRDVPIVTLYNNTGNINCQNMSVELEADFNVVMPHFQWSHTTTDTAIVQVNAPGTYTVTVTNSTNGCSATSTMQVQIDTLSPSANISQLHQLNCTTLTDTLVALPASGVAYQWSTGAVQIPGSNRAVISAPGTYSVTITQLVNSCTKTTSIIVATDTIAPIVVVTKSNNITCDILSSILTALPAAGVTYQWSSGATATIGTNKATVSTGGDYTVTVTTVSNGCTALGTVQVVSDTIKPQLSVTKSGNLTCAQTSVTITASSTTPGTNVGWLFSGGMNPLIVDIDGTYGGFAQDTANGCYTIAPMVVDVDTVKPIITLTKGTDLTCTKLTDTLTTTILQGGTYEWSAGATPLAGANHRAVVSNPGIYRVTVTDTAGNGCSSIASVNVSNNTVAPTVLLSKTGNLTCTKLTDTLTVTPATGASYVWSAGAMAITGTNQAIVSSIGNFSVTVTQLSNGCTALASVNVVSDSIGPAALLSKTNDITCTTLSSTLAALPLLGVMYSWSSGAAGIPTTNQATVNAIGNYIVTVTNIGNGCSATAQMQVLSDSVAPVFTVLPSSTLRCTGDTVQITASQLPGASYAWQSGTIPGPSINVISVTDQGFYTVTVTNLANGCSKVDSARVEILPLFFDLTKSGDLACGVANPSVALQATPIPGATYFWAPTPVSMADTLLVTAPGMYFVTAIFTACAYNDSIEVIGDLIPPIALCKPATIYVDANGLSLLSPDSLNNVSSDDCTLTSGLSFSASRTNFSCTDIGAAIPVSLFVRDLQNNRDTCQTTVTVSDTIKPMANCLAQQTLYLDTMGIVSVDASNINNGSIDNCGTVSFSVSPTSVSCVDIITPANITLTVTDSHNNQEVCVTSLIVRDTVQPVLQCNNVQLSLDDATGRDTVQVSEILVSGTDNCSSIPLTYAISDSIFDCSDIGQQTTMLVVTDGQGNQTRCTVQVQVSTQLKANAGADISDCLGRTATLNATATAGGGSYNFNWVPTFGLSQSNIPNPVDTILSTFPLVLTVIDNNGCTASDTLIITARPLPVSNAGQDFQYCSAVTTGVTLQGSGTGGTGALNYSWTPVTALSNPSSAMPIANPTSTQKYYLQVIDQFGCNGVDSAFVTVNASPTISLQSNSPICPGINLMLTATSSQGTLTWTNPNGNTIQQSTNVVQVPNNQVVAGNYTVLVTGVNGCAATAQTAVAVTTGVAFEAKFLTGSTACVGDTIQFVEISNTTLAGVSYLWNFGDNTTSVLRDPTHVYTNAGTYQVAVIASLHGCNNNMSVTKAIEVLGCKIEDLPPAMLAYVQPNITNGETTLIAKLVESNNLFVEIWDAHGKQWFSRHYSDVTSINEPLTFEREGVYFINLRSLFGQVTLRVVVVRG